jgi:hypothetical protein
VTCISGRLWLGDGSAAVDGEGDAEGDEFGADMKHGGYKCVLP